MRLIHTADWHLGRIFYGIHLTEDQSCVLEELIRLLRDSRPDALLISGDVYDRAVPPPEAVRLLDDVLSRICLDLKVPVIVIAGNHDSPERLGFGSKVLSSSNLHIFSAPAGEVSPIVLADRHGPVFIYSLPYAEPSVVRDLLHSDVIHDHNNAMQALLKPITIPDKSRSVLMAHAFVNGCSSSESERPLSVGGSGAVDPACLRGFSYAALGHLHCPQKASVEHIRYAGSLMKYSFAEAEHTKSVNLVEIDGSGSLAIEQIPLVPRRDVRRVEGHMAELLKGEKSDDYIEAVVLDREPILDAMGKLRTIYPNVLHLERPCYTASGDLGAARADHRTMGEAELFSLFFKEVTGDDLTGEQLNAFSSKVEELRMNHREV